MNRDFRKGVGISARLSDLLENDPKRILLAFAIMFSLVCIVLYCQQQCADGNDAGRRASFVLRR